MLYYNSNKIIKAYKGGSIVNEMNDYFSGSTPTPRLPQGYTEVEWVGSTSSKNSSFDTLIAVGDVTGNTFSIEGKMWTVQQSGFGYLISNEWVSTPYPNFCWRWNNNTLKLDTPDGIEPDVELSLSDMGDGLSGFTISSDGLTLRNPKSVSFFCGNSNTADNTSFTPWRQGYGKLYGDTKITKNGVLVSNLIPCKMDSDSRYGFYCSVRETFLTGTNLVGGDEVVPSGTSSETKAVFQYITDEQPSPLPYDAEIEYLESNGTQYINTSLYINTSNFEVGYDMLGNQLKWGFTHQGSGNGTWIAVESVNAFFGNFNNRVTISTNNTENVIKYESTSGITVNGSFSRQTFGLGSDSISSRPLYIFAMYDFRNGIDYGTTKLKSFYLKNNGELVLDMIPVRVGQVGYMYDKVSGQLFANAGSGSFILGNDI